jgi:hypothetical protein
MSADLCECQIWEVIVVIDISVLAALRKDDRDNSICFI